MVVVVAGIGLPH